MEIPDRAQVVIVGGGIVGCSVAYHLARRDTTDVVVLEQGELTGGTTWHAAGLVSQLKSHHSLTKLATYSARLFETLEAETGQATGYRTSGSISVATDGERWEEILRGLSMASTLGIEARVLEMDELSELWPLLRTDDLVGAAYLPRDGQTSPVDTTMALAKGAQQRGVRILEGVEVTKLRRDGERIAGVETEFGAIEAETVVLCSGMWTRHLAEQADINVPLQACEHFYLVTEPLDGVGAGMPTVRDQGAHTYIKEEGGKLMVGFFEPRGKLWRTDPIPRDFSFRSLPEDWEHIAPVFAQAINRVPALEEAGIQLFFNGPEAFTPDGLYHLGEVPELEGCFVAAGFNSVGIQSAGGVGAVLADWIVDGQAPMDLWPVDIRRTFSFESNEDFLRERIPESLGLLYAMHWPFRQYETARNVFTSPLHDRLESSGAVFGSVAGWERPNWFARPGQERVYRYSYGKQNWFDAVGVECEAVRNAVGLFDQSSFAKIAVSGPDALSLLDRVSANAIDVPQGKVVYTQWLNGRAGIEADLTITRLGEHDFLVVTAAATRTRDLAWLHRHARPYDVRIDDVTARFAVLGVMGPRSRALLTGLTTADLSNDAFPFGTSQRIDLAGVETLALRMSYVGELGWELYVPWEAALTVHDAVVDAGSPHGLALAGFHAMNSLRLEAGYRHWGHDLTVEDTPLEAGLGFAVDMDGSVDFIGRGALEAQRGRPLTKRLVQFRLEDPDRLLYHDEPIFRDGVLIGRTSSGMWSYTERRPLAMGYVVDEQEIDTDYVGNGTWEIEVALERIPATASLRSFYATRSRLHL
ncbi:MAG: FAD-dependent oxidoreductase [Actinobacteria bacterium]|jgi:4-methylaminobutanoate oxidase (formaldehyde-forming)|nr:FAD-dependent oxidoreductase [Actinomycetota bacterium]